MYNNSVIEAFTIIMADNTAYTRVVPSETTVGKWYVELYGGDDLTTKNMIDSMGVPAPLYRTEVDDAQVLAFVPWKAMYVPGNMEDSFFHYLHSDGEFGWIKDEITKLTAEINDDLTSDTPFNTDAVKTLRKLMIVGETLRQTRTRARAMWENRGIEDDMDKAEVDCITEMRPKVITEEKS